MRLVITEKTSVARNIAEVLGAKQARAGYLEGEEYLVSWCIGHLVELANADAYKEEWKKWTYESLPIIPDKWRYEVKESTRKQYEILEKLLHLPQITEVICATDAGREGELIFRLVYEQTGCSKPCKRLWISSMEEKAIREGFENLKDSAEYDDLYQSAVCRSVADWLVGINATRLFTVLYRHRLTVGRVQTPTLAMLVEREQDISEFKREKYYVVHILWQGIDAVSERLKEKNKADQIAGACQNGQALVISVSREKKVLSPPKLYDLTTLQREANRLFSYTAQQTLDYAQNLYEKKLVTYPRTDSQHLTEDMRQSTEEVIDMVENTIPGIKGIRYKPDVGRILNSKKVSDHHAIIPTVEVGKTELSKIPQGEMQLLSLIAARLICATGEKHIYESVKAEISCEGECFIASGKKILQSGWKNFETHFLTYLKADQEREKEGILPELAEGMVLDIVKTKVTEHYTSPPKHFTEDTLLLAMERAGNDEMEEDTERKGIGTPATRAAIIEKLVEKGFVVRNKKQMLPTENGIKLITVLPEQIKSPKLTAEWENQLAKIAKGEKAPDDFLAGIEEMVTDLVHTYHEAGAEYRNLFRGDREVIGKCPKCGGNVYESSSNFYCGEKCKFVLFKSDGYFLSMRKELTKPIVQSFLETGKARVSGLYSKRTGKYFSATIHMDTSEVYPRFSMEFDEP